MTEPVFFCRLRRFAPQAGGSDRRRVATPAPAPAAAADSRTADGSGRAAPLAPEAAHGTRFRRTEASRCQAKLGNKGTRLSRFCSALIPDRVDAFLFPPP